MDQGGHRRSCNIAQTALRVHRQQQFEWRDQQPEGNHRSAFAIHLQIVINLIRTFEKLKIVNNYSDNMKLRRGNKY